MRRFRNREDSLKLGLSFFLILGAVLGSVFCNGMTAEMKLDLCVAEQNIISAAAVAESDFAALFLRILPKRLWLLIMMFIVSTSQAAPVFFLAVAGYLGFSAAVLICPLTMDAGFWGLWHYALFVFPQCVFYIPVIYVLLWWMPSERKRLTVPSATVLVLMTGLGAAAECFLNPWFLIFL